MLYEFEDEAGERVEVPFPMGKAPKIGTWRRIKGRRLRRIPSAGAPPYVERDMRFVCWSQHPNDVASADRVTVEGVEFAAVSSRRQVEETVARSEGGLRYGDGLGRVDGGTRWT